MRLRISLASFVALAACATANPPQELVDARAAYQHAEQGPAQRYKPDELHEAHDALDQAEQAFKKDAAGDQTKTVAYVAQRKAQLADTDGTTAEAMAGRESATDQLTQVATQGLQQAQGRLQQTQSALATETQARTDAEKGRADAEQGRADAEKRAKDALDKLSLASVPVKQDNRGTIITLPGSVLFASNKSTLLGSAQDKLNQVATALKDEEDHQITVEGFTDSRGSSDSNQSLSERRAQSVRNYLVAQGLPTDHVNAMGMGADNPVADNSTAEGRANNRRVEIIVKPIEAK